MNILELKNVTKSYGSGDHRVDVLKDINLQVKDGEFVAIVGFSGSGKTTLINLIAGLIKPDSGEVLQKGEIITEPAPDRGVVFQNYSILPWLTVFDNVYVAVKEVFPKMSKKERVDHAMKYVSMVGLEPAKHKRPFELSGGMRQRVSVARALAMSPQILLLDEPLSALDALTRATLQDEIANIWEKEKKTVVLITNDVDEGILLADRIIALAPGPNAKLGKEFIVDLPRPRNKKELNHNKSFIGLRNEISKYLLELGTQRNDGNVSEEKYILPDLRPVDLNNLVIYEYRYGMMHKV